MPVNPPAVAVANFLAAYTPSLGLILGGNPGANLFVGAPKGPDELVPPAAVFVLSTGGPPPEPYLGDAKDFLRSRIQVTVRTNPDDEAGGETLARNISKALQRCVPEADYFQTRVQESEPIYLGRNKQRLYSWTINAEVWWVR